jgi:hypothetical protein
MLRDNENMSPDELIEHVITNEEHLKRRGSRSTDVSFLTSQAPLRSH